jgi:hypothetical protein
MTADQRLPLSPDVYPRLDLAKWLLDDRRQAPS